MVNSTTARRRDYTRTQVFVGIHLPQQQRILPIATTLAVVTTGQARANIAAKLTSPSRTMAWLMIPYPTDSKNRKQQYAP